MRQYTKQINSVINRILPVDFMLLYYQRLTELLFLLTLHPDYKIRLWHNSL